MTDFLRYGVIVIENLPTEPGSLLLVAERFGLPRAPRITRSAAQASMSPLQLSFMSESRRLDNRRIKQELHVRLRYPQVADGVEAAWHERKSR